ncbi:MAG: PspC domain-containing protein [Bacteroidales bacterium]|nr:PspC domain-containing protein [Bacteroidales bacterium]
MRPVENVSIGGYVFCLENDACSLARNYLSELESFYSKVVSGAEIMEGIEERMAELLIEKRGTGEVVTLGMVESVISVLGKPEAIEEESESERPEPNEEAYKVKKKLYRDPANGKVAGVCSGLGTYLGIDPTIFRLIFTILTLAGAGFFFHRGWMRVPDYLFPLVYVVLWICMPVAKTVMQRDELKGERGDVDAISARIKSGAHEVEEAAGRVVRSDFWPWFWRLVAVCVGIVFLVTGVAGVVSLGCLAFDGHFLSNTFFLNKAIEEISREAPIVLDMLAYPPLTIALVITAVIPFIGLIYGGVLLLFNLKEPKWHPGICLLVIWLIAAVVLAVLTVIMLFNGNLIW